MSVMLCQSVAMTFCRLAFPSILLMFTIVLSELSGNDTQRGTLLHDALRFFNSNSPTCVCCERQWELKRQPS